ncbi:hypothetical protein SCG7086_DF_00040 [Chlamydiales bacterium SCGC AG-110-P3]|nr:hypothetical protein SCG7086_DF_00040 [Chlamydiales bacterium SCGC AG-110-P3]
MIGPVLNHGTLMSIIIFTYLVQRLLGMQVKNLEMAAHDIIEIAPEETSEAFPSFFLKNDLQKITGLAPYTNWGIIKERLFCGIVTHSSTKVLQFNSSIIRGGYKYTSRTCYPVNTKHHKHERQGLDERVLNPVLASTEGGNTWFGHWITDDLTLHLAAEKLGTPVVVPRPEYAHEVGYRQLLDVEGRYIKGGKLKNLTILQDFFTEQLQKTEI